MTTATTRLDELPGSFAMQGPSKMREDHWEWKGHANVQAQVSFILVVGEEKVAIVRIFYRFLEAVGDYKRSFRAMGIGGVWVRPELRGKGYGTEIMNKVMAKAQVDQGSADVAVLWSRDGRLYETLGFEPVSDAKTVVAMDETDPGVLYAKPIHGDIVLRAASDWNVMPKGHF